MRQIDNLKIYILSIKIKNKLNFQITRNKYMAYNKHNQSFKNKQKCIKKTLKTLIKFNK